MLMSRQGSPNGVTIAAWMTEEEAFALEELVLEKVEKRRAPAEDEQAVKPIEVGQVWLRESGEIVEVCEIRGDYVDLQLIRNGESMGTPGRMYLREHYRRLPYRRETGGPT